MNPGQLGFNLLRNYTSGTSVTSLWTPSTKMSYIGCFAVRCLTSCNQLI